MSSRFIVGLISAFVPGECSVVHYSKIFRSTSEEGQSRHLDRAPATSGLPR